MKPILSQKAPRLTDGVEPIKEWESSADQLTDHGRDAFKARQEARRIAVQSKKPDNVKLLKERK